MTASTAHRYINLAFTMREYQAKEIWDVVKEYRNNNDVGANKLLFEEIIPHLTSNLNSDVEGEQWAEYVFFRSDYINWLRHLANIESIEKSTNWKNPWTLLKTTFRKIFGFKDGRVSDSTIHN